MSTQLETICATISDIPVGYASALDCANMFMLEIEAMKASQDVYAKKVLDNISDITPIVQKVITTFTKHKSSEFSRVLTYRPKEFHAPPGKGGIPLSDIYMDTLVDVLMERVHTANWYMYRQKEKKDWDVSKAKFNNTTPDGIVDFAQEMMDLHDEFFNGFYKKVTSATKKAFDSALEEHKKTGSTTKFRVVFRSLPKSSTSSKKSTPKTFSGKKTSTSNVTTSKSAKTSSTEKKVKVTVIPKNLQGEWKKRFAVKHGIEHEEEKVEKTDKTETSSA